MQVRAFKSPAIQSRPGPKWLLSVSKFEVPLAWNKISGQWWAQGCYRGLVWGPNRRLLFQRHRLLKRKVGQMHWSKGGLYWKIMLKPSSNLWVKSQVLRTYWTPLVIALIMDKDWTNVTTGGRASGVWPQRVQNSFCTNIVRLYIKSKVMKSRIQWCIHFALGACLGVTRGQKVGLRVLFSDCHPTPLRLF